MRIIRGKYGRRRFDVPKNITARPTTDFARENLFNVLENIEDFEGKTALDLFAGTGAISWEFASRGCKEVVAVEQASVQAAFIRSVKEKLGDTSVKVIKGDVFKYISTASRRFDFVFADPPYDHPRFEEIPELILSSPLVGKGTVVIIEHSKNRDFSTLPGFSQHRVYGSVNFSIFIVE
ncbi:MAG: RsmD family RNA methyltransferase [Muribaculaceae bacterium]|nr:RsmD family RNA methyltransferase [Muribaculaceae bacterium]MDE6754871.1 RsmD family RNA methyltransferase [Muribaculaceae bacterium]